MRRYFRPWLLVCLIGCSGSTTQSTSLSNSTLTATPTTVPASGHDVATLNVTLVDNQHAPVQGWSVFFNTDAPGATITQPASNTAADGTTFGSVSSTVPGSVTINAVAVHGVQQQSLGITATVQFTASTQLAIAVNNVATAGAPQSITLLAHDGAGNLVPTFAGTVNISASDSSATVPPVYTFTAVDGGQHQFANALILRQAGSTTVHAVDTTGAATAASATVNVSAGPASQLIMMPSTVNVTATVPTTVTVIAEDSAGNPSGSYAGTVHFASSDANAVLPTDTPYLGGGAGSRAVDVQFNTAGSQTLTVSDPNNPTITAATTTFNVALSSPTHLHFVNAPTQGAACSPLDTVQVEVLDGGNNRVTTASNVVTLQLTHATRLSGNLVQSMEHGLVSFAGLQVPAGLTGTWIASTPGLPSIVADSNTFISDAAPRLPSIGTATGQACVTIPYSLQQDCAAPADITVQYSLDGTNYQNASQGGQHGHGVFGVQQVPSGFTAVSRSFFWDASHDLGPVNANVTVRVQAHSRGLSSNTVSQGNITLQLAVSQAPRADWSWSNAQPCVLTADVNHDAIADLLTCASPNQVLVRLGDGNGTFATPVAYTVGNGPSALASGDLNHDGNTDIAAVNLTDATVSVLLGSASGSLTVQSPLTVGAGPVAVALVDVNHDGKLDVLTSDVYPDSGGPDVGLAWAAGNGAGGVVGSPTVIKLASDATPLSCAPGSCNNQRLAMGDLSKDGWPDVVTLEEVQRQIIVVPGTASGFGTPSFFSTSAAPQAVTLGDLDADGNLDVVVANGDTTVQVFLGLGNGVLQSPFNFSTTLTPAALDLADVNADGHLDVLYLTSQSALQVLLGDGHGNLQVGDTWILPEGPAMVAHADLNRDTVADVLVASNSNIASVFLSQRVQSCSWGLQTARSAIAGANPVRLVLGDFDRDGKTDVWTLQRGIGNGALLLGDGGGEFGQLSTVTVGSVSTAIITTDMQNDGYPDVLALSPSAGVVILAGDGNGSFAPAVAQGAGTHPVALASADINSDGYPDVVATTDTSPGSVAVLLNDGNGLLTSARSFATSNAPQAIAAGDLNNDGHPDVVTANSSGGLSVLLGTGDGTLGQPNTGMNVGIAPLAMALNDVDGDGNLDVLVACAGSNAVALRLGDGTGTFGPSTNFALGAAPTGFTVQDLNGDGAADWVATLSSARLWVGLNMGGGTFALAAYSNDIGATDVAAIDTNGDGAADIITANPNSGSVTILRGNTGAPGTFLAPVPSAIGLTPQSLAAADINRDGLLDAVVANAGTSTITYTPGVAGGLSPHSISVPTGTAVNSVVVGDINRDGWPDVVTQSSTDNGLFMHLSSPGGALGAGVRTVTCNQAQVLCLADFNTDGILDVAVACPQSTQVLLLPGRGDGGFFSNVNWTVPGLSAPQYNATLCADVNNDANPDLLISDSGNAQVVLFLGNGGTNYGGPQNITGIIGAAGLALGDVNRDGNVDLVVSSAHGLQLALGTGNTSEVFPTPWTALTTTGGPASITLADINGDGLIDLLAPNATTSTMAVFLGDGSTLAPGPVFVSGGGALQAVLGGVSGNGTFGRRDVWLINRTDSAGALVRVAVD